jgi:hypothetical protein
MRKQEAAVSVANSDGVSMRRSSHRCWDETDQRRGERLAAQRGEPAEQLAARRKATKDVAPWLISS